MGFRSKVTKNGMVGDLYFVIVEANDRKLQGFSGVRLRSFESKSVLHAAIDVKNETEHGECVTHYITDEVFEIPLDATKNLSTKDAYEWIRENHYPLAIDE